MHHEVNIFYTFPLHFFCCGLPVKLKQCFCFALVKVKVWFQNRRTKHKRQKLEEESPDSPQKRKGNQHVSRWRVATQQGSHEDIDVISED